MSLVSVLGFGNVGQRLCQHAINSGLKIMAVADSSGAVISNDLSSGLSIEKLNKLSLLKENGKLNGWKSNDNKEKIVSLYELCSILPTNSIVADCSASDETTEHLLSMHDKQIPITMANKKPLSGGFKEFEYLTSDRDLIGFESTVGAGLPVISSLNRLLDSGDKIIKIEGQLSGTIGYILSELQSGNISFSECVKNAKDLGFTEPDPRDDLSGVDVARKALIIARCMGIKMELNHIKIDSLYSKEMQSLSIDEFMNNLHKMDDEMQQKILSANKNGNRLRYIAVVTKEAVKVGLEEVSKNNALYNLVGTDNLISMKTEWYKSPLVVSGPGAGIDVTAAGVLSDIYKLKGSQIKKRWVLPPQTY